MIKIANVNTWVHDQDEALAFYTDKLGWEVRADATLPELGDYRWLAVGPPGQDGVAVVLNAIPGPPVMDEESAEQVRTLMAKGWLGSVFLQTDDCRASYEELKSRGVEFTEPPEERRASYEELKSRGVEFTEPPEERPYGIDSGFRDPSGNSLRLTEVKEEFSAV